MSPCLVGPDMEGLTKVTYPTNPEPNVWRIDLLPQATSDLECVCSSARNSKAATWMADSGRLILGIAVVLDQLDSATKQTAAACMVKTELRSALMLFWCSLAGWLVRGEIMFLALPALPTLSQKLHWLFDLQSALLVHR